MKKAEAFKVIECRGNSYEIGLQSGEGCRENIRQAMEMTFGGLAYAHSTTKDQIIEKALLFLPKVKDFDPELVELLRGQAEGAGLTFEEVFALKCGFDLGAYYKQIAGLCTSFAATGAATASGKTLLGQNIDWFPGSPMDLLKIVHSDGVTQLSLVLWGIVEYTLSSSGFGMCANGTWVVAENCLLNLPVGCYLPKVMRQRTLGEAMGILRNTARGLGYYHLASAEKEMIGIESTQDDYQLLSSNREMLIHSNHYLTDRFKPIDLVNVLIPDSLERIETIKRLMNDHYGKITPATMMSILADHENHPYSICRHVDETKPPQFHSETIASYIMVPEDKIMFIAKGNPCQNGYLEYRMEN
ncbi:MAG: hypothetical protein GX295_08650 [Syntrophomonadaceae bacterium]|nr:hypothetical protein [Syntrophomonadaceae bacterium]